jgi:hypothetical protein
LRAIPTQLCDAFQASPTLHPACRRLLQLALDELRAIEGHLGYVDWSERSCTSACAMWNEGQPSRRSQQGPRSQDDPQTPWLPLPRRADLTVANSVSDFRPLLIREAAQFGAFRHDFASHHPRATRRVFREEKAPDDALAREVGGWGCSESARAPVVHGDRAAAERLRRDQLEPSRAGQPALVQGWAVAGDPGVNKEFVTPWQLLTIARFLDSAPGGATAGVERRWHRPQLRT